MRIAVLTCSFCHKMCEGKFEYFREGGGGLPVNYFFSPVK